MYYNGCLIISNIFFVVLHPNQYTNCSLVFGCFEFEHIQNDNKKSGYFSETKDWFIGIRAYIHKLLVGINYWGTEPGDSISLESFNMTLEKVS